MRVPELTKDVLHHLYIQQSLSFGDIATMYGCSRTAVYRRIQRFHLQSRTLSDARRIALEQDKIPCHARRVFNEDLFFSWSPDIAYVLGVIATDGCLSSASPTFAISQKTPELLEKVNTILQGTSEILKSSKQDIYHINFNSRRVYDRLIQIGITPRKSLTIIFPEIPDDYRRHFVRGCWDGNGSVFFTNQQKIRCSYVSGSERFITGMAHTIEQAGILTREKLTICTSAPQPPFGKHPVYTIKFGGYTQCFRFFQYLYEGVPESHYLLRKYQKFTQIFALRTPTAYIQ